MTVLGLLNANDDRPVTIAIQTCEGTRIGHDSPRYSFMRLAQHRWPQNRRTGSKQNQKDSSHHFSISRMSVPRNCTLLTSSAWLTDIKWNCWSLVLLIPFESNVS